MNRVNFTADRVTRFECEAGKKQTIHWDAKAPGLGLRVSAGGAKSYVFESRLDGKTIRITIGDIRTWTIAKAQAEATRLKAMCDQGIDPRQQKAEQLAKNEAVREAAKVAAFRESVTVSEAWQAYLAYQQERMALTHIEKGKKWGERHMADHLNLSQAGGEPKKRGKGLTVQGVLYPLLQMRMVDIDAEVLTDWQRKEAAERANNARQGFEMFRAFWRWCGSREEYRGIIDRQAVENPEARSEVPSRKAKRFDVLERAHLAPWFAAVGDLSNPVIGAYLQALLLTGARREELAALRWSEVDFRWGALWLNDKVEADGRKVPLTPYVSHLLAALPRRNEWVFSSPTAANGRIQEPRIPHNRALDVAGLPHVSLHGLRRTFRSLAEWVEMPAGVVAQIMGHRPSATAEKHYTNRPLELLAVWHGKYEAWILEQAGIAYSTSEQPERLRLVK
ncbi:MAG: integrase family protein [Chitinivorax sp.]